jgi:uncharacterized protein
VNRRAFLRLTAALSAGGLAGSTATRRSVSALPGAFDPYGKLLAADANGVRLPPGFTSRIIARSGQTVGATGHVWHQAPDGGACFEQPDGGWSYVSNSEVDSLNGGVGAIRFSATGEITAAYSILTGSSRNCAGGRTPWGTWLSCEETGSGRVWECNPLARGQGVLRPGLGVFNHEAAAVHRRTSDVYLSEDMRDSRLYRFVPNTYGDLSSGSLFAAKLTDGVVTWIPTSVTAPDRSSATTAFAGGEGLWISAGKMYFTTKYDIKVWELTLSTGAMRVMYDGVAQAGASLDAVDNVVVHEPTGHLYVCEDGGNMELNILSTVDDGGPVPFCRMTGQSTSELTGVSFNPYHDRMYVSSQRGTDGNGITYEITGPFRAIPTYRAAAQESVAVALSPAKRGG